MQLPDHELILRLVLATIIGALFGFERHKRHKPIGIRTYAMVCLAACALSILSAYGFTDLHIAYPQRVNVNTDPARLMVGMLTGIGFLGAGIIWRTPSGTVAGVTSAATILLVAILGIACGLGSYKLIAVTAVIAYILLISEHVAAKLKQYRCRVRKEAEDTTSTNKYDQKV